MDFAKSLSDDGVRPSSVLCLFFQWPNLPDEGTSQGPPQLEGMQGHRTGIM